MVRRLKDLMILMLKSNMNSLQAPVIFAKDTGTRVRKVCARLTRHGPLRLGNKMPGQKRRINLNTMPLIIRKQHRRTGTDFHFRSDGIKIVGKPGDMQECKNCHKILPSTAFTTHTPRVDGAYFLQKICRECHTVINKEQNDVKKKAPPKPNRCACCHREKILQIDHIHGSTTFRGWLCRNCNTGMGGLGDNLEGVLQGAIYLENDENKIIETLHKVYYEMFARVNDK